MALTLTVPQIPAVQLGTSGTIVYKVPDTANMWFVVHGLILVNTSVSLVNLSMYRAPTSGVVSDATAFMKDAAIPGKTSIFISDPITLHRNESIRGLCSVANVVTVTLSGYGKVT